jgi:hypothetical protein
MPSWPKDSSLSGTEKNPMPPGREPLPAHLQIALYKQHSGRGEGLIYNIPGSHFQMRQRRPWVDGEVAETWLLDTVNGGMKNASSRQSEPLVTCKTSAHRP